MKITDLFEHPRDFATKSQLQRAIDATARSLGKSHHNPAVFMLIFDTQKQRTWLAKDEVAIYCVLDWTREPEPRVRWYITQESVPKGTRSLNISSESLNERTGRIHIGKKKPRTYSKHLFPNDDVVSRVTEFLRELR
jgi:hypothetical protein